VIGVDALKRTDPRNLENGKGHEGAGRLGFGREGS